MLSGGLCFTCVSSSVWILFVYRFLQCVFIIRFLLRQASLLLLFILWVIEQPPTVAFQFWHVTHPPLFMQEDSVGNKSGLLGGPDPNIPKDRESVGLILSTLQMCVCEMFRIW